jgi:hypothetical protein
MFSPRCIRCDRLTDTNVVSRSCDAGMLVKSDNTDDLPRWPDVIIKQAYPSRGNVRAARLELPKGICPSCLSIAAYHLDTLEHVLCHTAECEGAWTRRVPSQVELSLGDPRVGAGRRHAVSPH